MRRRGRFEAREVVMVARGGGGGRSLGFSPMASFGGEAAEMDTRQRSTDAVCGALMGDGSRLEEERLELGWV
jgi:hypothetical protein